MAAETEDKLAEYRQDFALLIEAGFIAVKQLDEISARQIFKAAEVLNPESSAPKIGLGFIALNKVDTKESDKIFAKILKTEPENWLAMTFLGISHLLQKSKREKGAELVREALEKTNDETVKNLGRVTLEWYEKELVNKGTKAPFF